MLLKPHEARAYIAIRNRLRYRALVKAFLSAYFSNPAGFWRDCVKRDNPCDRSVGNLTCGALPGDARPCGGWGGPEHRFGIELDPHQVEGMADVERDRHFSMDAGRGGGKTFFLAAVLVWFVITREILGVQWKALTTSGSWSQLKTFLWPEIHLVIAALDWSKIPMKPFTKDQLLTFGINLEHGLAYAKAASDPNLMEGAHAKHMLILGDEAKMISKAKFLSIQGSLSTLGGWVGEVYTSIQGDPNTYFNQIQSGAVSGYTVKHVTKEELIEAGRIRADWCEAMRVRTGEDSDFYRNHILSLASKAGSNAMFQREWLLAAARRHKEWVESGGKLEYITAIGSDIASGGGDRSINAIRQGMIVPEFVPASTDTMQALGAIVARLNMNPGASCVYDSINQGVAFRDRGKELGVLNLIPFNGGHKTEMRDEATGLRQYADQRTAGFDHLAWLFNPASNSGIAVADYREEGRTSLFEQLLNLVMTEESNGKLRVESKRRMRARLHGESTDAADALMYSFWPEADGVIKKSWWRFWQPAGMKLPAVRVIGVDGNPQDIECVDLPEDFEAMLQSWQTRFREDDAMRAYQYVVGQVHAYTATELFIVDQVRARMDFPKACSMMNAAFGNKHLGAAVRLVDLDQNGESVINSMRRQVSNVRAMRPRGELISQANSVGVAVFSGGVYLPHPGLAGHDWVKEFMQECATFPYGPNQEQMRALCLGFGAVRGMVREGRAELEVWNNV